MNVDTSVRPAAPQRVVATRLDRLLARLSGCEPDAQARSAIRRLVDGAFPRPLDDRDYPANALNPGGLPVEVSFAEATPAALRCDVARGHPDTPLDDRRADALRVAGVPEPTWSRWEPHVCADRFGAFVSAVVPNDAGPAQFKAYLEVARRVDVLAALGPDTDAHTSLLAAIPGLRPHFVALCNTGFGTQPRMYYECTNGLALLSLVDWAAGLGLTRQALAAVHVARRLTGRLVLPEAGVLCAVRASGDTTELKLELSGAVLAADPVAAIRAVMIERPRSERAFDSWRAAIDQPVRPTVVSVRIATDLDSPRLSVYTGLQP